MAGLFDASRLYNVLNEQGLLPKVAQQLSPQTGTPTYMPDFNFLYAGRHGNKQVLAHEMTHAVQYNILQAAVDAIVNKDKKTAQEAQFLEAYRKLMGTGENTKKAKENKTAFDRTAAALYGKPVETDYDRYRTKPTEAQAWGVENMTMKEQPFTGARQHMDPSYTTEFDILLSMYDKLSPELKQTASALRTEGITHGKNWYREQRQALENATEFTDIFSDPFAPTIK